MTYEAFTILDENTRGAGATPSCQVIVYLEDRSRVVKLPDDVEVDIGRSSACTIQIDSERVSRRHALITRCGETIRVQDLGSSNGTWLNGHKVADSQIVEAGDEVVIGPATLVVTRRSPVSRRITIATAAQLEGRLQAETDRSQRYKRTFAVLIVRICGDVDATDAALARLAGQLRPMDELAEYGQDEFAVLIPEADKSAALSLAERLLGLETTAQLQIGIGMYPAHGRDGAQLMAQARNAMMRVAPEQAQVAVSQGDDEEFAGAADDFVVRDPQMRRVYELAAKVANTGMTVLVTGETGAGKDVVAQQIHRLSDRASGPFVRLNCACLPETLLESELFGHEKGAFTGADRRRAGHFESAHGGTIFLDEIGEISARLQAKLLRVLEERCFTRVGGTEEINSDVRVVCATNRNLEQEVERGAFREDLLYRISAFMLLVPPLRDRPSEVLPLADAFLARAAEQAAVPCPSFSVAARDVLQNYDWPGNVRQLRNAVERSLVLQADGTILVEHLPERVVEGGGSAVSRDAGSTKAVTPGSIRDHLANAEHDAIASALEQCRGNQTEAARVLGMSRRALIYKMEKYGLKPPPGSTPRRTRR